MPEPIEIIAPDHIRAGEPFALELLLRSASSGTANLNVLQGSHPLPQEKMTLVAGENHKSIPLIVEKPSHVVYTVRVSGDDVIDMLRTQNALAACPIYVDSPPRVLLVESQPALAEHLEKALTGEHIEVDVRSELPGTAEALGRFDLILLANVPADALSKTQTVALQNYVRSGGGLIAVGGDHAFTVGGYRHSLLEEMLPVISESHTTKPKPTLAMVLVLDISGSMNDPVSKGAKERNIDLAKEALRRGRHVGAARSGGRARF